MQKELIGLFSRVRVPESSGEGGKVDRQWAQALNGELAVFGYTLDAAIMAAVENLTPSQFIALHGDLRTSVMATVGADTSYRVLFNKFPYSTPDQHSYLLRRIIGYIDSQSNEPTNHRVLTCGHVIDPDLFDLDQFGACPVCQNAHDNLPSPENIRHDFQSITPLRVLGLADTAFIKEAGETLLGRTSSLSQTERAFVVMAAEATPLDAPTKVYRETLPLVYQLCGAEAVRPLLSGATDLLRIASYLSNPEADLSLSQNTRFKVSTGDKKRILSLLDQMKNPVEDMMRHRERWLRLGERLNPASADNARRYPGAAKAFYALRNAPKDQPSYNRTVEKKVRTEVVDADLLAKLKTRPGDFARRLDAILRRSTNEREVLDAFTEVADQVPSKTLFDLRKAFLYRQSSVGQDRIFYVKGEKTRIKIIPDRRKPVDANAAVAAIEGALMTRFAALPPMGSIYVSDDLQGMLVPINRRADQETSASITRGSRYPMAEGTSVVRLFVWWKGFIDVDLSLILLDANYALRDQVSYTNLRSRKVVHSGDITSAPEGGSEFVDFEIEDLLKQGIRYAVSSAISFRGEHFATFPCHAGYMERDSLKSGARYEPESVALKFGMKHGSTNVMPLIFDLETREVVYADLTGNASRFEGVGYGKTADTMTAMTQALLETPQHKTTFHDLIMVHAAARGALLVADPKDADVVFDRATLDQEAIMKEMLA